MSVSPMISVVIPCRNEAGSLDAALDALEGQDFPADAFEILVVDGGSTDGSCDIARARSAVRVLRDPGRGPGGARNVGIEAARGDIVAFTDADCVPRYDWLSSIAEVFEEHPDAAAVAGALRMPRDTLLGRLEDNDARAHYAGTITSNVAYRRDALLRVGGFAEDLRCCEDGDLAWRVQDAGERIVRDARPVVTHAPPEIRGSVLAYLRKQAWYARHDVAAHVRAMLRARRAEPDAAVGSTAAAFDSLHTLENVAWLGLLAGGLAARAPLVAGLGAAGFLAGAARRTRGSIAASGDGPEVLAPGVAIEAAKALCRGIGTTMGVIDLALPSRWRIRRPDGGQAVPRAASPTPAPRPEMPRAAG